jgi:hypothetical protein
MPRTPSALKSLELTEVERMADSRLLHEQAPLGIVRGHAGLRIQSERNLRQHWRAVAARARTHKDSAFLCLGRRVPIPADAAIEVLMHRLGGRKMDDDNLAGGLKAVQDGVALWLGLDDGDDRIRWVRSQKPAGLTWGHRVEITVLWAVEPDKDAHD